MKKLFLGLISLIFIYMILKFSLIYFGKGYEEKYTVSKLLVTEKYQANRDQVKDNYYLNIKFKDIDFTYQLFDNFKKKKNIVEKLWYYEDDNYTCLLPIFKGNKILFDIKCYDGFNFVFYHQLDFKIPSKKLNELEKFSYDIDTFKDDKKVIDKNHFITLYDNLNEKQIVAVSTYKGISKIFNQKISDINLFTSDVYERPISIFLNNFYLTADYNNTNGFTSFKVLNLKNDSEFTLKSPNKISFNSYILGTVDNNIYLFDLDNKVEYEIDLNQKQIKVVGSKGRTVKFYEDNKWIDLDIDNLKRGQIFIDTNDDFKDYDYIIKNNLYDYYYLFKWHDNKYDVYRLEGRNDIKTYLFSTTDYHKVLVSDDYIYYIDTNDLKYYSDKVGIKTILTDSEFEFNDTINFGVYKK